MAGPVFAGVAPHPPIVVPEVGRGQESAAQDTLNGFAQLRERLAAAHPDVLLLICPHGPLSPERFQILDGPLRGDLRRFGAAHVRFQGEVDERLTGAILAEAAEAGVAIAPVPRWDLDDHSAWVPLAFLRAAAPHARFVMITISFGAPRLHYRLGEAVARAIRASDQRVAIIASADGSHALKADGPYGFHPAAPRFEGALHRAFADWDVDAMLSFDETLRRDAAEDSVPSLAVLMGALSLNRALPRILSAEAPWGVGYMTAIVEIDPPEAPAAAAGAKAAGGAAAGAAGHPLIHLARSAVETYVQSGQRIATEGLPERRWLDERGGTFVSLHTTDGALRGCIGTAEPTQPNIAEEIIGNAIAAATTDPRFLPVTEADLPRLTYSVDLLTPPERVQSEADLDPGRYGVIVEAGGRRGLLLPALEGVSSTARQVEIARDKAGIEEGAPLTLYRFAVDRFAESREARQGGNR